MLRALALGALVYAAVRHWPDNAGAQLRDEPAKDDTMKPKADIPSTTVDLPEVTPDGKRKPGAPVEEKPQNQESE